MKKLLALALALLTLCGCAAETPEPTPPVTEPTEATEPPTEEIIIDYDSLELLEFDYDEVFTAAPMGGDLLLFCGMDQTTLIKVSGRNQKKLASFASNTAVYPGGPGVQVSENGVCFATEKEYVFLDENLEEVERVHLPKAWGRGVVSADLQTIYYSTGSELRSYSRQTGLDRLVRSTTHSTLALESLEVNDSVLVCSLLDHNAVSPTLFYSADTGELLRAWEGSISLDSAGGQWLAKSSDGRQHQIVLGGSTEPITITGWESFSDVTLVRGGVLIKTITDEATVIRFLNPAEATQAAVALEGDVLIINAWNADGILWMALSDGRLCRWELKDSEPQDAAACFGPYYSRENPDSEGLAALAPAVEALENTYGVKIHILEDAVAVQPQGMTLRSEYQVEILTAGLEELSQSLAHLTPEFLANLGKSSDDGQVHICLVRSVRSEGCFQFWDENGVARIALAVDENLRKNFYHGLGHIIDSRVLSKCTAFDSWKSLNPKDFTYGYDYTADADPEAYPGAFTDRLAMTSPVEDRASVFAHAMLADMDSVFESDTAQKKLSTLCGGIRKAFGLNNSKEVLPWEQYLNK